ncbi:MAG: topoisomerase C-terminal repeat-containing protein [Clostridia bacterium]|nr:topoisomerase C-terminal repeat-containing protein [Clostridia bacterium]
MIEIILIIAEKPSLARNIAASIGKMKKAEGCLYDDKYIVTWAFGHLFSLADIEDYSPNPDGRWSLKNIPCFPEKFEFQLKKGKDKSVDPGVKRQFEIIKSLCIREDVDTIVNAGDSDREGEIIVRICVGKTGVSGKSFKRLWLPDQTPQTINKALSEMKDEAEYENLANEGFARTYIDWLYGVNLTRYATLKTGTLLRVGRVIVPIVKAIYDRDMQIRNFKPEIYYAIVSKAETKGEEIELSSKEKFSKNELKKAQELCDRYNAEKAVVTSKKRKKDTINPGKLYSLTKLQNVLGKKYKMSMEESLKILQGLYEKGYVTYPRTNSEYLATAEQDKVKSIIAEVKKLGYPVEFKFKKTIFDDSKIESHSALTPTYKLPSKDSLSDDEYKVYSTIIRRFAAVFCSEECVAEKNEIKIKVGEYEEFTLKGTVILEKGWTKYDDYTKKDKILPPLEVGDEVSIDFKPCEKETNPPKHYTIETLNNYLKNPFKEDKQNIENESDEEEYRAIFEGLELGTEATRTGIIDNARKSKYIQLKKDVYTILPDGEFLIESLVRMGISMDKYKTSELGRALKKVFRGEIEIKDGVALAEKEIAEVFKKREEKPELDTDDGFVGDIAGKCPLCGRDVVRTRYGYGCCGYREGCKFSVNNVICQRTISMANMRQLLETGKTFKIEGFVSKRTGNKFAAQLKLENGKAVFDF